MDVLLSLINVPPDFARINSTQNPHRNPRLPHQLAPRYSLTLHPVDVTRLIKVVIPGNYVAIAPSCRAINKRDPALTIAACHPATDAPNSQSRPSEECSVVSSLSLIRALSCAPAVEPFTKRPLCLRPPQMAREASRLVPRSSAGGLLMVFWSKSTSW